VKTDDFIAVLANDTGSTRRFRSVLGVSLGGAVVMAAVLFFAAIGVRPDIVEAMQSGRFLFKFVVTAALASTAVWSVFRLSRPGVARPYPGFLMVLAPALLLGAVAVELMRLPEEQWLTSLIGENARFCLTLIPLLSAGPLACILAGLRQGAPSNPGLAGALAGLAASGIGATFYAANCTDDSPLFVLAWYPIATSIMTGTGFLIGRKLLRW
jgi:hypothetical protein